MEKCVNEKKRKVNHDIITTNDVIVDENYYTIYVA